MSRSDSDYVVKSDNLDGRQQAPGGQFEARIKDLSDHVPLEKLGFRQYAVPPGRTAWPYHSHTANEEAIFVVEGRGILRVAGDEIEVTSGDFLGFPADPGVPHQLINEADRDLVYLCVSTMEEPDVTTYPDSNKVGVLAGEPPGGDSENRTFEEYFNPADATDYWDEEIPDSD